MSVIDGFKSMFNKDDAKELIVRANEAAAIAKNPLVLEALATMRTDTVAKISAADKTDLQTLQRLSIEIELLDRFADWFLQTMSEGEIAAQRLEESKPKPKGWRGYERNTA